MTMKLAISLPDEQVVAARQAVKEGRASSVSAYISAALTHSERGEALADLVADMRAEDGKPTEEDYDWAERALGLR